MEDLTVQTFGGQHFSPRQLEQWHRAVLFWLLRESCWFFFPCLFFAVCVQDVQGRAVMVSGPIFLLEAVLCPCVKAKKKKKAADSSGFSHSRAERPPPVWKAAASGLPKNNLIDPGFGQKQRYEEWLQIDYFTWTFRIVFFFYSNFYV